ncbi:MAG TPA: penicillin acylase family protein [Rhodothermales bacterium]|nr:penicillin acylase family protein [Rhodothermales bacterium]
MMRHVVRILVAAGCAAAFLYVLSHRVGGVPPVGTLLDPVDGLYRTARLATHPLQQSLTIRGLEHPVDVIRDARGVPHIFARSDHDAIMAMGYVVASDRLFQMDFMPRVASGRLSEIMGPQAVETDRYLRQTGMELGARRNLERIETSSPVEKRLLDWYAAGVNAYVEGLEVEDLPFEFRLLGYRPDPFTPLDVLRLLEYMTFDLTYGSDDAAYAVLRSRLGDEAYRKLYPQHAPLAVPIIPPGTNLSAQHHRKLPSLERKGRGWFASPTQESDLSLSKQGNTGVVDSPFAAARAILSDRFDLQKKLLGTLTEGFIPGKGSNNWAVSGKRSATGAPILAGDMHLNLSLPAIWYEVHLVTPTMNTYGVTIPGAPLPVEAYNDYLGWAFTNTGADQIDHYALKLDASGRRYRYEGQWRDLKAVPDTIRVKGADPVVDTLYYAHFGPVLRSDTGAVAIRWMGHEQNRILIALWGMNHARNHAEFEQAIRNWNAPMQNILYADVAGNIAIRSAGNLPIRRSGTGEGLLDGTTDAGEWVGRIPFEQLPHAFNPESGYLTSTNQEPVGEGYPFYLGYDWRDVFRSMRIDALLSGKPRHTVNDFKRYQSDVHAVQRDLFVPLLSQAGARSPRADTLRAMLTAWDGTTSVDRPEPLVLFEFMHILQPLAWDEPVFQGRLKPSAPVLYRLLRDEPASPWFDVQSTTAREDGPALLKLALERTADSLQALYGWGPTHWRYGDHHKIVFKHITRSEALRPLWRGPMEYPGFESTLSPAGDLMTTHSASWRMVVDFSKRPPVGYGVYPGGESGNPFSRLYDLQIPAYVNFQHYLLLKPRQPDDLGTKQVSSRIVFTPVS